MRLSSGAASVKVGPKVEAYGFAMCYNLAKQSPGLALGNPDNTVFLALGKPGILTLPKTPYQKRRKILLIHLDFLGLYLHRCDWGAKGFWGRCARS